MSHERLARPMSDAQRAAQEAMFAEVDAKVVAEAAKTAPVAPAPVVDAATDAKKGK